MRARSRQAKHSRRRACVAIARRYYLLCIEDSHCMTGAFQNLRNRYWTTLAVVAYALLMDYFIYGLIVPLGPYSPAKVASQSQLGIFTELMRLACSPRRPSLVIWAITLVAAGPCSSEFSSVV